MRPVRSRSFDRATPMSRGSSHDAPSSVEVRPLTMPVLLKVADSPAKRRSAPSDRHIPPPYAGPLTAAMTGWGIRRRWGTSRE